MPPLDDYADLMPFIDEWETEQANFLGELLYDTLKPKTVIDFGCASGLYLIPFEFHKCLFLGVDADPSAGKLIKPYFVRADIRKPERLTGARFDLALCIEVAEHLQPEYADQLVENVANSADTVFWSAASVGQGGQNHWNEQPPTYWAEKFAARGFALHPKFEEVDLAIRRNPACQKVRWLIPNSMLLTRAK